MSSSQHGALGQDGTSAVSVTDVATSGESNHPRVSAIGGHVPTHDTTVNGVIGVRGFEEDGHINVIFGDWDSCKKEIGDT